MFCTSGIYNVLWQRVFWNDPFLLQFVSQYHIASIFLYSQGSIYLWYSPAFHIIRTITISFTAKGAHIHKKRAPVDFSTNALISSIRFSFLLHHLLHHFYTKIRYFAAFYDRYKSPRTRINTGFLSLFESDFKNFLNFLETASATFMPSIAAEVIPPAYPAPSPHG